VFSNVLDFVFSYDRFSIRHPFLANPAMAKYSARFPDLAKFGGEFQQSRSAHGLFTAESLKIMKLVLACRRLSDLTVCCTVTVNRSGLN